MAIFGFKQPFPSGRQHALDGYNYIRRRSPIFVAKCRDVMHHDENVDELHTKQDLSRSDRYEERHCVKLVISIYLLQAGTMIAKQ